jgi:hypothetical protein
MSTMKPTMSSGLCDCHRLDRRRFLRLGAIGAGLALGGSLLRPLGALAAGQAEALLLSCMDYRLLDDVARYMNAQGLDDKYDHVILAGASLGADNTKFPAWVTTFWEHLDTAIALHGVSRVIIIDHRDCGAYRVILGKDYAGDPPAETKVHAKVMRRLGAKIARRYPSLKREYLLMALDGSIESIAP